MLASSEGRCELPLGELPEGAEQRELLLGIRPEQVQLAATSAQANTLGARVEVTEPTGPDTLVFVTVNDSKLCCRLAPDQAPPVGQRLELQIDAARALLFDAKSGERVRPLAAPCSRATSPR